MENNPFDEQRKIFSKPTSAAPATVVPAALIHPVANTQEKADIIDAGRRAFNIHCSHCHAANAMSFEPSRDLRRLASRYGAKMRDSALATIKDGRPDKGMPTWKDVISDEEIQHILVFLQTVQRTP